MLESLDMIRYFEGLGPPILVGPQRPEIADWAGQVVAKMAPLTMPRYPLLGLPEFATAAALDHYIVRKRKIYGDFVELRSHTREQIQELVPKLEELDGRSKVRKRSTARCRWTIFTFCRCCGLPPSSKGCRSRGGFATTSRR